ncbi:GNAT family N-acetyltransferase [Paenibacillus anaericanus]|uniref:GNAT family N-acetyltransferase n=1 Tax=Paenibacillus anaericanus TaxID=170367 RepID=A0A433Y9J0_9BACL|nr:GNAT family N-acetyltransferase [Paenibacillus anaericanus]RUT46583.1 GNAT family N-acetyltransferase [Paenibacillus anaericanus]
MQALAQEDFYRVKLLLDGGHQHPEVISIIELNNPGWIFVDQILQPRSALVWSKGIQGFYLIGDHTNETFIHSLDGFISKSVEPKMKALSLTQFEVSGHHSEWDFEAIFPSRQLYQFEQLVLELLNKPDTSKNNMIKTINLKIEDWENQDLINTELITENINLFWSSQNDFKKKGYGFAAIDGSEIIGVCYSSFVTLDTHAIGVETVARYQNNGVGTYLATLLVEEIINNGFRSYWDCSLDNEASRKLALRLGFKQVHRYICKGFGI